jgi:hypothetical protein
MGERKMNRKATYRCVNCKGQIQATRKVYLTLDERGQFSENMADDFVFYCENDCFEESTGGLIDLNHPEKFLPDLVEMGLIEKGELWEEVS